MNYEKRCAAIREDMRDIMSAIAAPFGQTPEEYVGDDFGFEFGVDAADVERIHVTLLLENGAEHAFEDGGNVVLRVAHGEDTVAYVAPRNFTDEAFAAWDDDELWDDKLENIRVNVSAVIGRISGLAASAAKP